MPLDELQPAIDHLTLSVADMPRARAFYTALLAPLGLTVVGALSAEQAGVAYTGFGRGRKGNLWLSERGQTTPAAHLCFRARSRAEVRAFHAAGLEAGGVDHGAPGVREEYHPAYYAAFLLDAEGHNLEAVCFEPEEVG